MIEFWYVKQDIKPLLNIKIMMVMIITMQKFMITTNGPKSLALLDTTNLHKVSCKKPILYN